MNSCPSDAPDYALPREFGDTPGTNQACALKRFTGNPVLLEDQHILAPSQQSSRRGTRGPTSDHHDICLHRTYDALSLFQASRAGGQVLSVCMAIMINPSTS